MERVKDPADPERCKGAAPDGQCRNKAEHGSEYCLAHGGKSTALAENKRGWMLATIQRRVRLGELAEPESHKSLTDEIALARLLLEKMESACKTDDEFVRAAGPINTMLLTLERLLKTASQLNQAHGTMLAKSAVLKLGQAMCQIVMEELEGVEGYELIVDRITHRLVDTIAKANNSDVLALPAPH